jgi:hypothetical protein
VHGACSTRSAFALNTFQNAFNAAKLATIGAHARFVMLTQRSHLRGSEQSFRLVSPASSVYERVTHDLRIHVSNVTLSTGAYVIRPGLDLCVLSHGAGRHEPVRAQYLRKPCRTGHMCDISGIETFGVYMPLRFCIRTA